MKQQKKIVIAESAAHDLEEVLAWYQQQNVPAIGVRMVKGVLNSLKQIQDFPESGPVVPEFQIPNLRQLIRSPFRIVYRLNDTTIEVVRIWRFERLLTEDKL